ncbi:MAG: hypothetical protein MUQ32_03025, partial [Chloroflexi bacterium]|nr:hypothetical protein [Chloroflexota bacterium]
PRPIPSDLWTIHVSDLPEPNLAGPVMLADREGVFIHSFKCKACRLEFVVFSWLPNRHRVGVTFCPECGERTPMLHRRATVNESEDFTFNGTNEIFGLSSRPDSFYMSDSE